MLVTMCVDTVYESSRLYVCIEFFFFLMIRRPPRSTLDRSSAASDVYKRQGYTKKTVRQIVEAAGDVNHAGVEVLDVEGQGVELSLIHISEPTRPY